MSALLSEAPPAEAAMPAPRPQRLPGEAPDAALDRAAMLVRNGRILEALALADEVAPEVEARDDALACGLVEHVRAACHQYLGSLKESLVAGYKAIGLLERAGAPERLLRTITLQATTVARVGDVAGALELLHRAMQSLPLIADAPREACVFWCNAAAVQESIGRIDDSVEANERAVELCALHDELPLIAICHMNLAVTRLQQALASRPAAIEPALAAVRAQCERQHREGREHLVSWGTAVLADALIGQGRLLQAHDALVEALEALRAQHDGPDLCSLEIRLAQVERALGRHEAAAARIASARRHAQDSLDQSLHVRLLQEESGLHEDRGELRAALALHKQYAAAREALTRAQSDSRVQALAVRGEVERARMEAELLRLRNVELERDVHRMTSEADDLKRQAGEDPLTGVANRRSFHARVGAIARGEAPLVVLMIDIDHFKRVNDEHSHAVGDAVLRELGLLLQAQCRPHDLVARFGGEEFVVAFGGGLSLGRASAVAERLRATIEAHPWVLVEAGLRVTVSMGLAAAGEGEDIDATIARADAALYASKHAGRNRVSVAR